MPLHSGAADVALGTSRWQVMMIPSAEGWAVEALLLEGPGQAVAASLTMELPDWDEDSALCWPGAFYGGHPYEVVPVGDTEAMIAASQRGHIPIPDLPRLEPGPEGALEAPLSYGTWPTLLWRHGDGRCGWLQLCSATPSSLGTDPDDHKPAHGCASIGLRAVQDGARMTLAVDLPCQRKRRFLRENAAGDSTNNPANDARIELRAGEALNIAITLHAGRAASWPEFFALVARSLFAPLADWSHPATLPLDEATRRITAKFQRENWLEGPGCWSIFLHAGGAVPWEIGWTGGGMHDLAFVQDDDLQLRERLLRQRAFISGPARHPEGLFWSRHDGVGLPDSVGFHLIRRSGDGLLFQLRTLAVERAAGREVDPAWTVALTGVGGAISRIWTTQGDLGMWVDQADGTVRVAGSANGACACAALALGSRLLDHPQWLVVALEIGEHLHHNFVARGLSVGGPTDIIMAPDSESAYALLEAMITLWEETGESIWLERACAAAANASTWVCAYQWRFPSGSVMAGLGARTVGTVEASVANKHLAPGWCTYSGSAFLRLYRATGDRLHLDLARLVATALPQFLSLNERPVPVYRQEAALPDGWMNEAVLATDCHPQFCPEGELWRGSCWSEISLLLTWAELPSVYWEVDQGRATAMDHVKATVTAAGLRLHNPTAYTARFTVLAESAADRRLPMLDLHRARYHTVELPAGGTMDVAPSAALRSISE